MARHPAFPLLLCAALLAAAGPARAAEYHVDSNSLVPGNGDGSAANPWKQLSFATGLAAGDVVNVRSGTYDPFAITNLSGAAGNPITFRVLPGHTATINGGLNDGGNRDGIRIRDSSHLVIEGFSLVGTSDPATSRAGISVQSSALGSRLGNGQVSGNHTDVVLRNNTVGSYGKWGVFTAYVNDLRVEGNSLSGTRDEHGLYISNASTGHVVRSNTVFNNAKSGIQLNGDFAFGGGGIISNSVVENNVVFGNGGGSPGFSGGGGALNNEGVQDSVFRNNVLFDNHASGIVLWIGQNGAPDANSSNNNLVVNNTVIQAADGRAAMNIDQGFGNTLLNNIFFHPGPVNFKDAIQITTTTTGTVSDFNLVSGNLELAGTDRTFAQWQALTGGDADSGVLTLADVMGGMFADYGNNDFRLTSLLNNPAVDTGAAGLNGWTAAMFDHLGAARPFGAGFDIGAFELAPVPEPAAWLLLAGAVVVAVRLRTRGKTRAE